MRSELGTAKYKYRALTLYYIWAATTDESLEYDWKISSNMKQYYALITDIKKGNKEMTDTVSLPKGIACHSLPTRDSWTSCSHKAPFLLQEVLLITLLLYHKHPLLHILKVNLNTRQAISVLFSLSATTQSKHKAFQQKNVTAHNTQTMSSTLKILNMFTMFHKWE